MNEEHTLIRATLVPAIVAFLAAHYNVAEDDALDMFYRSKTAEAFADDDLGLYGQSALNLAGDVIQERMSFNWGLMDCGLSLT